MRGNALLAFFFAGHALHGELLVLVIMVAVIVVCIRQICALALAHRTSRQVNGNGVARVCSIRSTGGDVVLLIHQLGLVTALEEVGVESVERLHERQSSIGTGHFALAVPQLEGRRTGIAHGVVLADVAVVGALQALVFLQVVPVSTGLARLSVDALLT